MKKIHYALVVLVILLFVLTGVYIFLKIRNNTPRSPVTSILSITPSVSMVISPTHSPSILPEPSDSIGMVDSPMDINFIQEYASSEATQRPDITITNNVPFENEYFVIATEFIQANPGYFRVVVYTKSNDRQKTQEEFVKWVRSLGVPEGSISKLSVEYRIWNDPEMM